MIDNLSLAISHGLMMLAVWRLLWRADLDDDAGVPGRRGFARTRDDSQGPRPDA